MFVISGQLSLPSLLGKHSEYHIEAHHVLCWPCAGGLKA